MQNLNNKPHRSVKLTNDFDSPFSEPEDKGGSQSAQSHPKTDSNVDQHEMYDAGSEAASNQMHRRAIKAGSDNKLKGKDIVRKY